MDRHDNPLYRRAHKAALNFSETVYNSSRLARTEARLQPFWCLNDLSGEEVQTMRHLMTERDLLRELVRLK
jgi:hypothetical protein